MSEPAAQQPYPGNPYGSAQPYGQQAQPYGQVQPYGADQSSGQGHPFGQAPPLGQLQQYGQAGPTGTVRSTGVCILLCIVTLGFYSLYWYYAVHDEMKRHSGKGLGGGVALLLAFFVGIVMPYVTSNEVGDLYTSRGRQAPVTAATGLWAFPGNFILVGPIVWFVKTNGALNRYWESQAVA